MPDPNLIATPDQLQRLSDLPPAYFFQGQDWLNRASAADADAAQRLTTLRDLAQRKTQADIDSTLASTANTQAQLPGLQAISSGQQRDWRVRQGVPVDQEVATKLSDMNKQQSDNDLAHATNKAQIGMSTSLPGSPEYLQHYAAWQAGAKEQHERLKENAARELAAANNQRALQVAQTYATGRDAATNAKIALAQTHQAQINAIKNNDAKMAYIKAVLTMMDPNDPERAPLIAQYNSLAQAVEINATNRANATLPQNTQNPSAWQPRPGVGPAQIPQGIPAPAKPLAASQPAQAPTKKPTMSNNDQISYIRSKLTGRDLAAFNWVLTHDKSDPNYERVYQQLDPLIQKLQTEMLK